MRHDLFENGRRAMVGAMALIVIIGSFQLESPVPTVAADPSPAFLSEGGPVSPRVSQPAVAGSPPSGFSDNTVLSGLDQPVATAFAPDGRIFVAEKRGRLVVFDSLTDATKALVIDLHLEVNDFWDRGMTGLTLDPRFASNGYLYLFYAYDALPGGTYPRWDETCPNPPGITTDGCVVTGRLIRLTISGSSAVTGRVDLLSGEWCQQFPSHSADDLAFGPDGYLYLSAGDGANFNTEDWGQWGGSPGSPIPVNPCADPVDYGGSLRSQSARRPSGQPRALDGAILRLDPATGSAAPGNPYATSGDANQRRIVAYGLRNPYRFAFRPGTSELWIGDVGQSTWEEVDRFTTGGATAPNFGWPCWEAAVSSSVFQSHAGCNNLAYGSTTAAHYAYNHNGSGAALSGMAFYTGSEYPAQYSGALFFADYAQGMIRVMLPDGSGVPSAAKVSVFQSVATVDLSIGPGGDLFYADFDGGTIHRIRYGAPSAVASASPTSGAAPLSVHFVGSGSSSPIGLSLTYAWDLDGDGAFDDATGSTADWVYPTAGTIQARLQVTDSAGSSSVSAPIAISPANTAPTVTVASVNVNGTTYAPPSSFMTASPPANGIAATSSRVWAAGDGIVISGSGSDAQDGTLAGSVLTWDVTMHHCSANCHAHPIQTTTGSSLSFSGPDHEWPAYLSVTLTARDSGNLTASKTVYLYPRSSTLTVWSSPSGAAIDIDGSPSPKTNMVGHAATLTAPSTYSTGGRAYHFTSWSDGPTSATRQLTITASNQSLVARYAVDRTVTRLYGADRYATAAAISAATFGAGVPAAYVATGLNYPDALAAAAAAGYRGAPVLLVPGTSVPSVVRAELSRLHPTQIIILGGTSVVSSTVFGALRPYAGAGGVSRLSGVDRYGTAAAVSRATFTPGVSVAYVVSGLNYPDALAAAAAAGYAGGPVLLVPGTSLPATVRDELDRLNPARIVVAGGPSVISNAVVSQLLPLATAGVARLYGADRYATAVKISADAFKSGAATVHVATGLAFPDALAGAAAAAKLDGPVLLVPGTSLPASVDEEVDRLNPVTVRILGGPTVVSSGVAAQLASP
ncbi:MAG: cell wall-binding repeat-containing protein [Chloroflexota bacterium]